MSPAQVRSNIAQAIGKRVNELRPIEQVFGMHRAEWAAAASRSGATARFYRVSGSWIVKPLNEFIAYRPDREGD